MAHTSKNEFQSSSKRKVLTIKTLSSDNCLYINTLKQFQHLIFVEMRNAAISSLILDLLMLFAATVTAVVGLVTNQVLCLMVTGVMFVLTG